MACGRFAQPRRCSPSAMAPLETSTQRLPSARSAAICAAQRAIACASRPRPSLVTSDEPTLITSVLAAATALGDTLFLCGDFPGKKAVDLARKLAAALAVDGGDDEPRAFPAQAAHDVLGARHRIGREDGLFEDQPARLIEERGIVFLHLVGESAAFVRRVDVRIVGGEHY